MHFQRLTDTFEVQVNVTTDYCTFCLVTTNPNAQTNAIHGNIDAYDSSLCHCLLVNQWKKQNFFFQNESGGPEGGAIASSTIYLPLQFYLRDHFETFRGC